MNVFTLLTECRAAGVTVRLEGELLKLRGSPDAVAAAKAMLKPHKAEIIRHILAQFHFEDCADDPEPDLIDRINRMAFEFMQYDGMSFEAAIKTAAEIAVNCAVANCEASYADVRALWDRLTLLNRYTKPLGKK